MKTVLIFLLSNSIIFSSFCQTLISNNTATKGELKNDVVVFLKNEQSGKYMTSEGNSNGEKVTLRTFTGAENQKFKLILKKSGNSCDFYSFPSAATSRTFNCSTYQIKSLSSNKYIFVKSLRQPYAAVLQTRNLPSSSASTNTKKRYKFSIAWLSFESESFYIDPSYSKGYVLEIKNGYSDEGYQVRQRRRKQTPENNCQYWKVEKANN